MFLDGLFAMELEQKGSLTEPHRENTVSMKVQSHSEDKSFLRHSIRLIVCQANSSLLLLVTWWLFCQC